MKKILTFWLVLALLISATVPVFATAVTAEPSDSVSEPSTDVSEPTDTDTPASTEDSEEKPSTGVSDRVTVDVSDDSITAIAAAVNGSNTVSVTNKDGQSFSVPTEALPALDYKYVVFCGSLSGFNEWMGSDKPFVVDSDGWWCSPGTTSGRCFQFSGSLFLGEKSVTSNRIYGFQEEKVNYANHNIGLKSDGSLYYASDVAEIYTISFVTGFDDLVLEDKYSANFVAPVLEREHYRFDGWYLDSDFTTPYTDSYAFVADITLYAKWTAAHEVKFVTGFDDYEVDSVWILDGDPLVIPTFAYSGYQFMAAYKDADFKEQFVDGTAVTGPMTLYLRWTELEVDYPSMISALDTKMEVLIYAVYAQTIITCAGVIVAVFFRRKSMGV